MDKQIIEVGFLFDDSGESYYILPSGFEDMFILVNESPSELLVDYISEADLKERFNI
jgi:hypothetical protein